MDKGKLLDRLGAAGEDRLVLAKILDRAEQARSRNIPAATDFLSPAQLAQAGDLLRLAGFPETGYAALGGYEGAERRLLLFLPDWLEAEDGASQSPIRCLRASFRPEYKLTHRDFLGSLMGMGIVREKTGDILVGPDSADLIVLDTVADFLLQSWDSAGRAKLTVSAIGAENLHLPAVSCREVRDTVVESGRVQVNWRECTKPDKLLAAGDTVSARGFGKFEVSEVGGVTKKGRTSIVLKVYV